MLQIKNVSKYYVRTKPVISDISLSFGDVGLNMIVGKSGCGKTTLLNMIGTMDQEYIGSILFNDVELVTMNNDEIADFRNYQSAYVFQINSLFEDLTVKQNIEMALNLQGNTTDIDEILDRVGLSGFGKRRVKYLSGGEKQRVGIARAIAKDCKVILADEPTSALDSANSHKIFSLLKEISKDRLVILVTHDVKKARLYADRIIRLVDGSVAEDETINEVNGSVTSSKYKKVSSNKTLRPIFWSQIRRTVIINLFIALVLAIGIIMSNIATEDGKIMSEYDIIEGDPIFNEMRVLNTHELNDINFYNIIPRGEEIDKYSYFREYKSDSGGLFSEDIEKLSDYLVDYNIHQNSDQGKIIIEGLSTIYRFSEEIEGRLYYWYEPQKSNYNYFLYDSNNNYDLLMGRVPIDENEIMITDIIAKEYLLKQDLDASDLSDVLEQEFTVYDIYHSIQSLQVAHLNYHFTDQKQFKVVGIINTNQIGYFDYNLLSYRYEINKAFLKKNQNLNEPYLNNITTFPDGYIVTMEDLDAYRTITHFYDEHQVKGINYNGIPISDTTITTFHGSYEYKTDTTIVDNLSIDRYNREIVFSSPNDNLQGDEIIVTDNFIRLTNPGVKLGLRSEIINFFESNLKNQTMTMTFIGEHSSITKVFTIVGVAKENSSFPGNPGHFYFSEEVVHELKHMDNGLTSGFTVELKGATASQRKAIIKDLFDMGYLLSPVNRIPGAYLEFVASQGEMEIFGSDGFGDWVNLSVYHLFSPYYNTKDMNEVNSVLEIVSSIYTFVLVMTIIIAAGFIYLKERRQKLDIMKLTQLGVRTKNITRMNIINYIFVALFMIIIGIAGTIVAVDIINEAFILEMVGTDGIGLIHRVRVLFTGSSITITIIVSVITFILSAITTSIFTKSGRR